MDEDAISDSKQFVAITARTKVHSAIDTHVRSIVHEEARTTFKDEMRQELLSVHQKNDDLSDTVRDALNVSNEANGEQFVDHETRLNKLKKLPLKKLFSDVPDAGIVQGLHAVIPVFGTP